MIHKKLHHSYEISKIFFHISYVFCNFAAKSQPWLLVILKKRNS